MTRFDGAFEPIAFSTRSGFDESLYHGAAVALGPDGRTIASLGDPDIAVYPRSSLKPMQATAMVECGLELPGDLLAIVCASHDGTAMHTAAVLEVLGTVGLDDSALRNKELLLRAIAAPIAHRARKSFDNWLVATGSSTNAPT